MFSIRFNLAVTLIASVLLAPTVSAKGAGDKTSPQSGQAQTQEYVDARMHETLASIDKSLDKLLIISRGGEPARKPGIIGPTVAGQFGPARTPITPGIPPTPPMDPSVLQRRVQIQWNGSPEELLRTLSNQLGFSFSTKGIHNRQPNIRLEGQDLTVEQTLNLVASQLRGQSDIVVSLPNRKIELVGR